MPDEFNPPIQDPANNDKLVGAFATFEKSLRLRLQDMLPAKVLSFDRSVVPNRVTVQPMIKGLKTGGTEYSRGQQQSIPVQSDGGGGFLVNYNLEPGDLGWIKANDRDISLFLQSMQESPPNDLRMQDFSSAVFFPDMMQGFVIDQDDYDAMVIQNLDGSIKIALSPGSIKLEHPTTIKVTTALMALTGDMTIDGTLATTGNIDSDATIEGATDVIAAGISGKSHTHDFINADSEPSTTDGPN